MTVKYEVHNQLTGLNEEAQTYEEAKILKERIRAEYIATLVDPLFIITVMVQNEDGSWTQGPSDEEGFPILAKMQFTDKDIENLTTVIDTPVE